MIEKQCKICGKTFYARQENYKTCSMDCQIANRKILRKERDANPDIIERDKKRKKSKRDNIRKSGKFKCKICGEAIIIKYKRMHEECVIRNAINSIQIGCNSIGSKGNYEKNFDIIRAKNTYGYNISELRKIMHERGIVVD